MTNAIVPTTEEVFALLESKEDTPVDFDLAWQWAGYTRKENAVNKLKRNFELDIDYCTIGCKSPDGGRPSDSYVVSLDCFKMFCMMAGTDQGKEVRRHFLNCEKELIARINKESKPDNSLAANIADLQAAQNIKNYAARCAAVKAITRAMNPDLVKRKQATKPPATPDSLPAMPKVKGHPVGCLCDRCNHVGDYVNMSLEKWAKRHLVRRLGKHRFCENLCAL